jgi:hypothetical protein
VDALEMRFHEPPEIGQMRAMALAPEQGTAQFRFELFDRSSKRRLGDIAALRGAREIQGLAQCQEVANLMHFHIVHPLMSDKQPVQNGGEHCRIIEGLYGNERYSVLHFNAQKAHHFSIPKPCPESE